MNTSDPRASNETPNVDNGAGGHEAAVARQLQRARPAEPSAALRARVLATGRAAWHAGPAAPAVPPPAGWQLWRPSAGWLAAAALLLLGLLLNHLLTAAPASGVAAMRPALQMAGDLPETGLTLGAVKFNTAPDSIAALRSWQAQRDQLQTLL